MAALAAFVASSPPIRAQQAGVMSEGASFGVHGIAENDVLNMRAAPLSTARVVATIPPHATGIKATGRTRTTGSSLWAEVTFAGRTGWVNTKFLVRETQAQSQPAAQGPAAAPEAEAKGPPPSVEPPRDPSMRPLVPRSDECAITLLGKSADPACEGRTPREPAPDTDRWAEASQWAHRCAAAARQNRYQEALEACSNAIKAKPDWHEYWENRALLYKGKRDDLFVSDMTKAIELTPVNAPRAASYRIRLGQYYEATNQQQLALHHYDDACRVAQLRNDGLTALDCFHAKNYRAKLQQMRNR